METTFSTVYRECSGVVLRRYAYTDGAGDPFGTVSTPSLGGPTNYLR